MLSKVGEAGKTFLQATVRDVTAEKQILVESSQLKEKEYKIEQLKELATYARSLIEASIDPFIIMDMTGKITDVNYAAVVASGFSREELIGANFSDEVIDKEKAADIYRRVLSEGYVANYQLHLQNKANEADILCNASLYKDINGKNIGIFAAIRDITEQKRIEEIVQKRTEELERLNKVMVGRELKMVEMKKEIERQAKLLAINNFHIKL